MTAGLAQRAHGAAPSSPARTEAAPVRLALTLGDPRGIGPAVSAAAVRMLASSRDDVQLVMVGPEGTGADTAAAEFVAVGRWEAGGGPALAGRLAGQAIERAAAWARDGRIHGMVTAPIDKAALHAGGYAFPGHTEMLAAFAGVPAAAMMLAAETTLAGGPLRVVLATTHMPLADVPRAVTTQRVIEQARLAVAGLRDGWDIHRPRVALCALNPHASDGGLFGDEEARTLAPARTALLAEGIDAAGPIPADTVFVRALRGEFDVVIAPYHDVGMAAFKTVAFGHGVNITLGLPFVRTSPDHGTALDIAGRGLADPSSMIEAVRLASRLARRRQPVIP